MKKLSMTKAQMKQSLIKKTAITLALLGTSGYLYADNKGPDAEDRDCKRSHNEQRMDKHEESFLDGDLNRQEKFERKLGIEDIRTLSKAKLIMRGNENLKIGEITKTKTGYNVAIVTQDNSLVKTLDIAANGMPLKKYEHIKERMKNKDKK
jgi:hypothetical protein